MNRSRIAFLSLLLISSGCASGWSGSEQASGSQVEEIKARILELQRQAAVTRVELDRLRQEVAMLRARQPAQQAAAEPAPSGLPERFEPQVQDRRVDTPAGGIEASELEPASVAGAGPGEQDPEPPLAETEAPAAASTPAPSTAPMSLEPLSPEAQRLYDRGYTFYHQGNYVDAEAAFRLFLQENPRAELSDNASYWIGESRYARGDLQGALAAFRETLEGYPRGNKVPDALLKIADCLAGLGDREGARISYGEVVRRFPDTAAAVMAQERRQRLD